MSAPPFDPDVLRALYARYGGDLASLRMFEPQMPAFGYAVHKEARKVLYLIVEIEREHAATSIVGTDLDHEVGREVTDYRSIRRAAENLRRNGLAHRVKLVYGDARVEAPSLVARLDGIEFLFLDSDHGSEFARWYIRALFPCIRRQGVIQIDDIMTDPRNFTGRHELFPMPPTGEEEEVVRFLLANTERYTWFSLADSVRRAAYLDAVRPFGGGDVSLDVRSVTRDAQRAFLEEVGTEWNPSLWVQKIR